MALRVYGPQPNEVAVVHWDHDKVLIGDLTTSVLARHSPLLPGPYVEEFVERRKWFRYDDVRTWEDKNQRGINTTGDLADMLTDFLYKVMRPDGNPVLTKDQTVQAKNYILRGLTVGQVEEIIQEVPLTDGVSVGIERFRLADLAQTLFSDGLGIAVDHQRNRLSLDAGGGVPALLEGIPSNSITHSRDGLDIDLLAYTGARLSGDVVKYDKWEASKDYRDGFTSGLTWGNVAIIDDSAANVRQMKAAWSEGAVVVAFNPTEPHFKQFKGAGIPVLKQDEPDVSPFVDIVLEADLARRAVLIQRYCV